jgi:hypothetical protein
LQNASPTSGATGSPATSNASGCGARIAASARGGFAREDALALGALGALAALLARRRNRRPRP